MIDFKDPQGSCAATPSSDWSSYMARVARAKERGFNPSRCLQRAIEEVNGEGYCARHAKLARIRAWGTR